MSVALEAIVDLADPAAFASELQQLNDRLASEATIPADIADEVRNVAVAVERTGAQRFEAVDPAHAVLFLHSALSAQRALEDRDSAAARNQLRLALEAMRQSLTAIAEREPVSDERSPKEILRWLAARTEVSQTRLAELFSVSPRQLQRWLSESESVQPEGDDARRVRLVARLVNQLRFTLTPAGTVEWFWWPRTDLDQQRPFDLLDDPAAEPKLQRIAGAMRGTIAA